MVHSESVEAPPKNMVWIDGGQFWMGSEDFYPEERPVHQRRVSGFWMDTRPVTVAEFRRFVSDTGYTTTAEVPPSGDEYSDTPQDLLVPGSLVFVAPLHPVPLDDFRRWWEWTPGAFWRRPEGPASNVGGREHHPVTHVSFADARAYATWAGKYLPTEAEWEYAARGGLDRARFAWGQEYTPGGRHRANTWQGQFPHENLAEDGYTGTSPVGTFAPNGYGLYDITGNVWEWTDDCYTGDHSTTGDTVEPAAHSCCTPVNPVASEPHPRRVIKGGSHLCAANYCLRYRPAARQSETEDTSTCHLGFRCVIRTGGT